MLIPEAHLLEWLISQGGVVNGSQACESIYKRILDSGMANKAEAKKMTADLIVGLGIQGYIVTRGDNLVVTNWGRLVVAQVFDSPPEPMLC